MNESARNRWLSDVVRRAGARVLSTVGNMMQEPGWPDRYWSHPLLDCWVEGKTADAPLGGKQRAVCDDLLARGTPVVVARYWPELLTLEIPTYGKVCAYAYSALSQRGGGLQLLREAAEQLEVAFNDSTFRHRRPGWTRKTGAHGGARRDEP